MGRVYFVKEGKTYVRGCMRKSVRRNKWGGLRVGKIVVKK